MTVTRKKPRREHRQSSTPKAIGRRILLGKNVGKERAKLGLTKAQLAERVEMSVPAIYNIEKGEAFPSMGIYLRLVDVLCAGQKVPLLTEDAE